ncbi:lasso peptide biosynthesis B2 protein [Saccharothrix luteola]|uniref:lasso peptide biosynthesis B2 protein n=1 Tax=Saccharothrix luteola TaxID=2893018 RepID=UPI001E3FF92B|nr:lasso peptide biosynthesis B2 protein [Saccharothrix luteola]MCC8250414.1 lasso peptide biosynthesis B2 protein [Saccharothrix luteola]
MTSPGAITRPPRRDIALPRRVAARLAVAAVRPIARWSPARIRAVLTVLRRGARPATHAEAKRARDAVLAISLTCAGPQGCLPRSLATALLCRMTGTWPTWCAGARKRPPFGAHAWVEVDGRLVDEQVPADYFIRLIVVPPAPSRRSGG